MEDTDNVAGQDASKSTPDAMGSSSSTDLLSAASEIKEDPDRILELHDACPECGGKALEALTWKSRGLDDVTVGCWECGWHLEPADNKADIIQ